VKIAILSMQRVVNYGSVLQAYSLRSILQELTGETVDFLDIEENLVLPSQKTIKETMDYEEPAAYPPGLLQKAKRWIFARLSAYNRKLIRQFMVRQLQLKSEKTQKHYDCVIVGSDEVFNHAKGVNLQLHGKIENAEKVISYAASCGSAKAEDIAPEDVETVKSAMRSFSAISVRDSATQRYVSALHAATVEHHLDPVLVGNLYQREHKPVRLKKYLLVYAYGQRIHTAEEIQAIQEFAHSRGLKTVAMGGSQFWCDLYMPAKPFRVLDYFYYADYVVTDTFHGAIFSVIQKKQFAVIVRKTNENKLKGLMEDLNLQGNLLSSMTQLGQVLTAPIHYDSVEQILDRERVRARVYLQEQLGGSNG